jgi:HSP20 family protein
LGNTPDLAWFLLLNKYQKLLRRDTMKTMTLYRPGAIQHALSDIDRYFESFFGDSVLAPSARVFNHPPAVDIRDTENAYMLEMELPGYNEKDIDIHIEDGILFITSKQEEVKESPPSGPASPAESASPTESASPEVVWLLKERRSSSFSRSFKLPVNANPEEVSAEFKNGILSMEIKKRAEAQKRAIQINAK